MVIKILLILALVITMLHAVRHRRESPLVSMATLLFGLVGIFCVIMPGITTVIANLLGVGRGADLLLYCFIIASVLTVFNLHLRVLRLQETMTELARQSALSKAPGIGEPQPHQETTMGSRPS